MRQSTTHRIAAPDASPDPGIPAQPETPGTANPAPTMTMVLDHLYRLQAHLPGRSAYLDDLASALGVPLFAVRACVESLRDQGLVISTGAGAHAPCVCLSLKGLSLAARRHRVPPTR